MIYDMTWERGRRRRMIRDRKRIGEGSGRWGGVEEEAVAVLVVVAEDEEEAHCSESDIS